MGDGTTSVLRTCLCLLSLVWLLMPVPGALAGALTTDESPPYCAPEPGRNDFSLLFPPGQRFSFLDLLTVSPIGETRSVGLAAVSGPPSLVGKDKPDGGSFPDKSKSYLFSFENTGQDNHYVGFAWFDRQDIGQTSKMYADEYKAELMVGYSVTNLCSVLFGKGMQLDRPGDTSLKVQDDGWRLKFIKKF